MREVSPASPGSQEFQDSLDLKGRLDPGERREVMDPLDLLARKESEDLLVCQVSLEPQDFLVCKARMDHLGHVELQDATVPRVKEVSQEHQASQDSKDYRVHQVFQDRREIPVTSFPQTILEGQGQWDCLDYLEPQDFKDHQGIRDQLVHQVPEALMVCLVLLVPRDRRETWD